MTDAVNLTREQMLAALEQAATEVNVWKPEKPGDNISGTICEIGTITTEHGDYVTTTLKNCFKRLPDGTIEDLEGLWRIAWMGAVLVATEKRLRPDLDDFVSLYYQKDITPKKRGYNDYPYVSAVVLDHRTGKSKKPIELDHNVPTEEQLENIDPETGEIPPLKMPTPPEKNFGPEFTKEDETLDATESMTSRWNRKRK